MPGDRLSDLGNVPMVREEDDLVPLARGRKKPKCRASALFVEASQKIITDERHGLRRPLRQKRKPQRQEELIPRSFAQATLA
jgi:hypothetical protein